MRNPVQSLARFLSALALLAAAAAAHAQEWPNKPIRYIVPFAPGGTTDTLGRMVSEGLTRALGQPVVVDNKAGQGGSIGMAELARSKPDGYTVGGGTMSSHALNVALYAKLPYDAQKDFAPVTQLASLPNMLLVHPSLKVNTVAELVALLKANPNKYSFGSSGNGTSQHIAGEMFKIATGTDIQHVPYKGSGPMMNDLLAGTIHISIDNITSALPMAQSGRLKALAVTSAKRSAAAPELPTMQESGLAGLAGYEMSPWQALFAPAGTPPAIIARLNKEVAAILNAPENRKRLTDLGLVPGGGKPEELAAMLAVEIPRVGKVVKQSGAKID